MDSDRKTAVVVGVLFIVGTVAGSLSVVLTAPALGATDYLAQIAANEAQVVLAAIFVLVMAAALVAVPIVIFPVFKRHDERMAIGYVVARAIEGAAYISTALLLMSLVALSRVFVEAGAPDASTFQVLGDLLLAGHYWADLVGVYIVFNLGALLFYYLLFRSRLIPRLLSAWGFVAALMWLTGVLLVMFGVMDDPSVIYTVSFVPMFAQEMVMALWLIVKGFNTSALTPGSADAAVG